MTDFEATVARVPDFEETVKLIIAQTKLTRDQVMALIWGKWKALAEAVTPEGAAGMVAEELGVKVDG